MEKYRLNSQSDKSVKNEYSGRAYNNGDTWKYARHIRMLRGC